MIDPIALQIGTLSIRWYGVMIMLALLCSFFLFKYLAKQEGIKEEIAMEYYLVTVISLFIGARIFHAIFYSPTHFLYNPIQILFFWEGGLSSHGAIVGGSLGAYLYAKKKQLNFWKLADLSMIVVALGAIFVRFGNFLNQEIVGRATNSSFGVLFEGYEGKRHPVQLYEALQNTFIFIALITLHQKKENKLPESFIFWLFIFLFSTIRFFLEFFKEYLILSQGLTMGQYLCLVFALISGWQLWQLKKKNK